MARFTNNNLRTFAARPAWDTRRIEELPSSMFRGVDLEQLPFSNPNKLTDPIKPQGPPSPFMLFIMSITVANFEDFLKSIVKATGHVSDITHKMHAFERLVPPEPLSDTNSSYYSQQRNGFISHLLILFQTWISALQDNAGQYQVDDVYSLFALPQTYHPKPAATKRQLANKRLEGLRAAVVALFDSISTEDKLRTVTGIEERLNEAQGIGQMSRQERHHMQGQTITLQLLLLDTTPNEQSVNPTPTNALNWNATMAQWQEENKPSKVKKQGKAKDKGKAKAKAKALPNKPKARPSVDPVPFRIQQHEHVEVENRAWTHVKAKARQVLRRQEQQSELLHEIQSRYAIDQLMHPFADFNTPKIAKPVGKTLVYASKTRPYHISVSPDNLNYTGFHVTQGKVRHYFDALGNYRYSTQDSQHMAPHPLPAHVPPLAANFSRYLGQARLP